MESWRPAAPLAHLKKRSELYQQIRSFFAKRSVLEVETPIFSQFGNTDPNIECFQVTQNKKEIGYLHTSPEFAMKRMLAAGVGDIYQFCKVFRQNECGRFHCPEFTMLEWYRVGWHYRQLIIEVCELLQQALPIDALSVKQCSYQELWLKTVQLDPLSCDDAELIHLAKQHKLDVNNLNRDGWLDLIMSHIIVPIFQEETLTVIYDYPVTQAALAQIRKDNIPVAERFELYWGDVELANGYQELTDVDELMTRMEQDNLKRLQQNKSTMPIDQQLIAAQQHGLPVCSGVALGVDRLLMCVLNATHIKDVISFYDY